MSTVRPCRSASSDIEAVAQAYLRALARRVAAGKRSPARGIRRSSLVPPVDVRRMDDESHIFDSFECAIQALAPTCSHCGCRIIGHGAEADGEMYGCAYCASKHGVAELQERA